MLVLGVLSFGFWVAQQAGGDRYKNVREVVAGAVSAESDMNALLATSHRPRPAAASVSAPLDLTTHPDVRIASPEGRAASNRPSVSDFLSATSPGTKQTGTSQVPTASRTAKDSSKQQLLAKTRGDSAGLSQGHGFPRRRRRVQAGGTVSL